MTTPTSYDDHDDADTITPERAQTIADGYAESRDRINRQIAVAATRRDVTGLDDPIERSRRYDALATLWDTYVVAGPDEAAQEAGTMIYRAVERSQIDTARLVAARAFLGDIHDQHHAHTRVVRHITHGIA